MRETACVEHNGELFRGVVKSKHDDGTVTIVQGIEYRGKPLSLTEILEFEERQQNV